MQRRMRYGVIGIWSVLLLGCAIMLLTRGVPDPAALVEAVRDAGPLAPIAATLGYALLVLLLCPATPLNIAAGLAFGAIAGPVVSVAGASLAAAAGYGLARASSRATTQPNNPHATKDLRWGSRLQRLIHARPLLAVAVVRLAGIFPFGPASYALAAARVPFAPYMAGSVIGLTPGTAAMTIAAAYGTSPQSPWFTAAAAAIIVIAAAAGWLKKRLAG